MEFVWTAHTELATASTRRAPQAAASTTTIKEQIVYLLAYHVLVCKEHATAVQNIDTHLRVQHAVPPKRRAQIVTVFRQHGWAQQPEDVTLPAPLGPPIPELGPPLDGLHCAEDDCDFLTIHQDALRKHRKREHNASWNSKDRVGYTAVKVQTFFQKHALRRYFVVHVSNENSQPSSTREEAGVVEAQLANWKETRKKEEERAYVMEEEAAKTDKTGWFKRTGWLEHLAKRNRKHLAHQIRLPDRNEIKLQRAGKLVELLI